MLKVFNKPQFSKFCAFLHGLNHLCFSFTPKKVFLFIKKLVYCSKYFQYKIRYKSCTVGTTVPVVNSSSGALRTGLNMDIRYCKP